MGNRLNRNISFNKKTTFTTPTNTLPPVTNKISTTNTHGSRFNTFVPSTTTHVSGGGGLPSGYKLDPNEDRDYDKMYNVTGGHKADVFSQREGNAVQEYTPSDNPLADSFKLTPGIFNTVKESASGTDFKSGTDLQARQDAHEPSFSNRPQLDKKFTPQANVVATGNFDMFSSYTNDPYKDSREAINESKKQNPDAFKNVGAWADPPKISTFTISGKGPSTAASHGQHQTKLNQQQLNREYNQTSAFWRQNFLTQTGENKPTKEDAKKWIDSEKQKLKDRENVGGYNTGSFQEMYMSDLDSKFNNLYNMGGQSNNIKPNKNNKGPKAGDTGLSVYDESGGFGGYEQFL